MNRGLWREHQATPKQRLILRSGSGRKRQTQADLLTAMLREARSSGKPLDLPAIMQAGIAQHSARFNEIRARGFVVENELERDSSGMVRSRYWLRFDPEREGPHAE